MIEREEAPIERFYKRIKSSRNLRDIDIPASYIWYARAAIESKTGVRYTVEHVQIAAWLEGLIDPEAVTRIPAWYVKKYMNGKQPDFRALKFHVEELYKKNLNLPF